MPVLVNLKLLVKFLEKAIEIEYSDTIAFELATLLYDQEEYQKANFYFKQIETMSSDFEGYEYNYALSLHAEHRTEEALRMTQQGISKNALMFNYFCLHHSYPMNYMTPSRLNPI
mgnify:CR=1 FL=1